MGDRLRVGVFGGTFDPPHLGHLFVAQEAVAEIGLDRVLWVPAGRPPHKTGTTITEAATREEMVRAAIRGNPTFTFSDVELVREGPSYTVDTLRSLKQEHPSWSLSLLVGADQVAAFPAWKEPAEIASMAEVVAVGRGGRKRPETAGPPDVHMTWIDITRIDVSASLVRHRIAQGKSVRYMVPDAVLSIIERERLYRS